MHRMPFLVVVGLGLAPAAWAQEATHMEISDVTGTYSDAVDVEAVLTRESDNGGVEGVNIEFYLRNDAGDLNVDLGVVRSDGAGHARLTVPLVNGCDFWGGAELTGGTAMAPVDFILEARFAGGDDVNNLEHDSSSAQGTLHLLKETSEVQIVAGTQAQLGGMLTVTAKIVDANGDAPCDRSAPNGGRPSTVAAHALAFFLDYTGDEDYSDPRESLGRATTMRADAQSDALASVTADLTPVDGLPHTGTLHNAIQVQLPANDAQYLPSTARGLLVLEPAPVDPARTEISTDPGTPSAGGEAVAITITLRDTFGNALGRDDATHTVTGVLDGDPVGASLDATQAERDPNTGLYKLTMQPTSRGGTVKLRLDVDGIQGATHDIVFKPLFPIGPCACARALPHPPWFLLVALGAFRRRRSVP